MKLEFLRICCLALIGLAVADMPVCAQRKMESLDRGLIAIRKNANQVFLSWRLMGTELENTKFYIYRDDSLIAETSATNYIDTIAADHHYLVNAVINDTEKLSSTSSSVYKGFIEIPLTDGDYYVQHAWPGDLDGDGQMDFVISRLPNNENGTPIIEAYKLDGTHLWRIDMGPKGTQQTSGIGMDDAPPAAISGWGNIAGYRDNDNITVYDLDMDGKAEVVVRTGHGTTFSDSSQVIGVKGTDQFISVIDGLTGIERDRIVLTDSDYSRFGPFSGHMGIAYLDGERPSIVTKLETRSGNFFLMIVAYDFSDNKITERWRWKRGDINAHNFHQIRVIDVNGDRKDDICDGTYVINSDGTFLYSVEDAVHGDRFHVTDMDPNRPGLEGYAIQQAENGNTNQFPWYYYDAATGERIVTGENPQDVGRGTVADIDPTSPGYEMWSVEGVWNKNTRLYANMPVANFKIWWDGDLLGEMLDRTSVRKWNHQSRTESNLFSAAGCRHTWRNAPPLYGDVIGDWREEVLWETNDHTAMRLYTTTTPTDVRLYTLLHNPAYRNCLAVKGYYQSNLVDYYLGDGMETPEQPDIEVAELLDQQRIINLIEDQKTYIIDNLGIYFPGTSFTSFAIETSGQSVTASVSNNSLQLTPIGDAFGFNQVIISASGDGMTTIRDTLIVNVMPANDPPTSQDFEFTIPENSDSATVVGTIAGEDIDGDQLQFLYASSKGNEVFDLNRETGVLSVKNSTLLDYEEVQSYEFVVRVYDGLADVRSNITVLIGDEDDVLNIDEARPLIYPNPSSDWVKIKSKRFKRAYLLKLSGEKIAMFNRNSFSIAHLKSGIYLVMVEDESGNKHIEKLVKK